MIKRVTKRKNFTLIELVAVISIIAITTTIAAVQLNLNSSRSLINNATRDIVNIFHNGRMMALNGNKNVALILTKYREKNLIFILQKNQQIMKKLVLDKKLKITANSEKKEFLNTVQYEIINSPNYQVLTIWKFYKDGKITGENLTARAGNFVKKVQISNLTGVVNIYDDKSKKN